jgi:hypothetical protein
LHQQANQQAAQEEHGEPEQYCRYLEQDGRIPTIPAAESHHGHQNLQDA